MSNFIRKILQEAEESAHALERISSRFLSTDNLNVGYEINKGIYKTVGTYSIPENIKEVMRTTFAQIKKYNFPKSKDLAIKVADIIIDKNKVNYLSDAAKQEAKPETLVFVDVDGSNGNSIYAIVRQNNLTTIYLAKSYVAIDVNKLRVDFTIKNLGKAIQNNTIR